MLTEWWETRGYAINRGRRQVDLFKISWTIVQFHQSSGHFKYKILRNDIIIILKQIMFLKLKWKSNLDINATITFLL